MMKTVWMMLTLLTAAPHGMQAMDDRDREFLKIGGAACAGTFVVGTVMYIATRESNSSKISKVQKLSRYYKQNYDFKCELSDIKKAEQLIEFSGSPTARKIYQIVGQIDDVFLGIHNRYQSGCKPWNWGSNMATAYVEVANLKESVWLASMLYAGRDWLTATSEATLDVAKQRGCSRGQVLFPLIDGASGLREYINNIQSFPTENLTEQKLLLLELLDKKYKALVTSPQYFQQKQAQEDYHLKYRSTRAAEESAKAEGTKAAAAIMRARAEKEKVEIERRNAQTRMEEVAIERERLRLQRAAAQSMMGRVVHS